MENTNIMTKKCKFLVEAGICNGKSCKTCHYNEQQPKEIAQNKPLLTMAQLSAITSPRLVRSTAPK